MARLDRTVDLQTIKTALREERPYVWGEPLLWRGRIAAILGNRREAVRLLEEAHREGQCFELWLHRDIDLESLRGYPPFDGFRALRN